MSERQIEPLSEREQELVQLLSRGLSNREIARDLCISHNTVKVHLRNIYGKLNVSSRTEATMVAVRMGWVQIDLPQGEPTTVQPEPASDQMVHESSQEVSLPEGVSVPEEASVQELALASAAAHVTQETPAFAEATVSPAGPTLEEESVLEKVLAPPLALWQRIYLVFCALLVALGLWLIWPSRAEPPGPFSDRPQQASNLLPDMQATSRWENLAQMPTPRTRLAVVAYRGHIYAIAGETSSGVSGVVEIYSPDVDDWERGADKLTPVANVGAVVLGQRIYVPGGSTGDGRVSDRLEVYDPDAADSGAWTSREPLPKGVSAYAIAAYAGKLYLFGGWDGTSYLSESYMYDPQEDTWRVLAPMATPRAFAGAGAVGDRFYVVGGYDGQTELATCEVYDPGENAWYSCPPMNAPRGGVGVAVIAETLYVIGGGWDSYLVENEYFSPGQSDPSQSTWQTFPSPLLQEWRNLGVTSNETSLFAIGGWDGEYLGVNRAYRAVYRLYMPGVLGRGSDGSPE